MKITRIIVATLVAPTLFTTVTFAQPSTIAPTNPSDYATDVRNGQDLLKNDTDAAKQSSEVKSGEIVEGNVDDSEVNVNEVVEADEAVEAVEAEASHADSSESGDAKTDTDGSSNDTDSSSSSSSSDKTSSTSSTENSSSSTRGRQ